MSSRGQTRPAQPGLMRHDQHAEDLPAPSPVPASPVRDSPEPDSPEVDGLGPDTRHSPEPDSPGPDGLRANAREGIGPEGTGPQPGRPERHDPGHGHQEVGGLPAGAGGAADQAEHGARVRVGTPAGILAVVPHLLGFHPSRSLVVLGVSSARDQVTMAFRYDLPDPPDPELTADVAAHAGSVLARQGIGTAILIGYGPEALVRPVIDETSGAMTHAGVQLREVLRAEGGRYWSALCHDATCCPADGVFYDPCSHPAAVALNQAAGRDAYPDRAALARTLEPEPGTARAIRQATNRAVRRIDKLLHRAQRAGRDPGAALAQAGRDAVRSAIDWYRTGARITDRGRLAFLAVTMADLRVRDDAWALMDPDHRGRHLRLWTDVLAGAAPELAPAPAALLAFTAWQCGDGALANVALERALAADPEYSLALLLSEAVRAGLPPEQARPPMTPDEVAASYGEAAPADSSRPDGDRPDAGSALDGAAAGDPGSAGPEPDEASASGGQAGPRRQGAAA
jgi:Domain of unknown function (DUF4192)